MANNPLKKYFRQPKVYIDLPSKGLFNQPGTLTSDPTKLPIFGMTGMDEILLKTPDALLNGEATVKVVESCCPNITDGWDLSVLDLDLMLVAIRIATSGNTMTVTHTCGSCEAVSDYDIDLGTIIQHFSGLEYDNRIVLKDVSIKIQPLNYKQWNEFQLKNFAVQRQLQQALALSDEEEQNKLVAQLFDQVSKIQTEMIFAQIESVEAQEGTVNQREFIREWLENSDAEIFDAVRGQVEKNRKSWVIPKIHANCPECNAENDLIVDMDQASFFASA
jgi:hypothetical protein